MATDVGTFDIVDPDDLTTILFQLNQHASASTNPGLVRTMVRELRLRASANEYVRSTPLTRDGGRTLRVRRPLVLSGWQQRLFLASGDQNLANLRLGAGRLQQLLERGGVIKWTSPDSVVRYIDYEPSDPLALLGDAPEDLFHALTLFDYPGGIPLAITRQPGLRGARIDSGVNLLGNPTLTIDVSLSSLPDMWGWDNTGSITSEGINNTYQAYQFTIATTATRNLRQRIAAYAQNDLAAFGFYILAESAGVVRVRAVIEYLNSSDAVVGTETASSQIAIGTSWTLVSVTKGAAGAGTARARVSVRFENVAATSVRVWVRNAQEEKSAALSSFRCSTQRVTNDPSADPYHHVDRDSFTVSLAGVGAGNVNSGAHSYGITFLTEDGETDGDNPQRDGFSWPVVTTSAGDGQVDINNIPLGGAGVIARGIYRTGAGGSEMRLLTHLLGNETTYRDNIADAGLGALAPSTSTVYLPGKALPIFAHGDMETPLLVSAEPERGVFGYELWLGRRSDGGVEGAHDLPAYLNRRKIVRAADGTLTNTAATAPEVSASGGTGVQVTHSGEAVLDNPNAAAGTLYKRVTNTLSTFLDALRDGEWDVWLREFTFGRAFAQLRWGAGSAEPQYAVPQVRLDLAPAKQESRWNWARVANMHLPDDALSALVLQLWSRRDAGSGNSEFDYLFFWPTESALRVATRAATKEVWLGSDLVVVTGSVTTVGAEVEIGSGDTLGDTPSGGRTLPVGRHRWTLYLRGDLVTTTRSVPVLIRNVTDSTDLTTTFNASVRGAAVVSLELEITSGLSAKLIQARIQGPTTGTVWVERMEHEIMPYVGAGDHFYVDCESGRYQRRNSAGAVQAELAIEGAGIQLAPRYQVLTVAFLEALQSSQSVIAMDRTPGSDTIQHSVLLGHSYYPRYGA